jgi:hypothetical protein
MPSRKQGDVIRMNIGGAGGIRTLDRALQPYNGLANRRLQPLGHSSVKADMPDARVSRKRQIYGGRIRKPFNGSESSTRGSHMHVHGCFGAARPLRIRGRSTATFFNVPSHRFQLMPAPGRSASLAPGWKWNGNPGPENKGFSQSAPALSSFADRERRIVRSRILSHRARR